MATGSDQYDAVVIGSGFGGSVAASTLTDGGARVLLLERGPWRDTKPVRDAGIEDREPLPYGCHFYTHAVNRLRPSLAPEACAITAMATSIYMARFQFPSASQVRPLTQPYDHPLIRLGF